MKVLRKGLALMAAGILVFAAAGCSGGIDWSSVKNDDVVAKYGDIEIYKKQVAFKYAIDTAAYASSASMYQQLGLEGDAPSAEMDESMESVLAYALLTQMAEAEGMAVSYDDAYENAYEEYVLAAKKYDYLSGFSESIKSMLYLSDELLVERAAELYVLKNSAEAYLKSRFEASLDSYEDFDSLKAGVQQEIRELVADKTATVMFPREHKVKYSDIDFDTVVQNSSWNYSSVYTETDTDS